MAGLKVLAVTGLKAEGLVREAVSERRNRRVEVEVAVLPTPVAALITPRYALEKLKHMPVERFNLILLPGLVKGDVGQVGEALGTPTFKGPKHAADLPEILNHLPGLKLSTVKPACEVAGQLMEAKALREIRQVERRARLEVLKGRGLLVRRGRAEAWWAPGGLPILLAEIADASKLSDGEIAERARRYVAEGADMVDIGMEAGGGRPDEARRAVRAALKAVKVPVSIDSADPDELEAAVKAGASLILSGDASNLRAIAGFARRKPTVVTAASGDGTVPEDFKRRVAQLEENLRLAERLGLRRVVADPLLGVAPPYSLLDSILGYWEFSRRNPGVPTFFGVGNVTELSDVDSPGLNFALALLGLELNVAFIFTVEASAKTVGSVWELRRSLEMAALSRLRRSPPKDLGLNLLVLKEKKFRFEPLTVEEAETPTVEAKPVREGEVERDPKGSFKIKVNPAERAILAFHYRPGASAPSIAVKGRRPEHVYRRIVREGLVSRLDHAAYLGMELCKAYIALKTGRSYLQDEDLFG